MPPTTQRCRWLLPFAQGSANARPHASIRAGQVALSFAYGHSQNREIQQLHGVRVRSAPRGVACTLSPLVERLDTNRGFLDETIGMRVQPVFLETLLQRSCAAGGGGMCHPLPCRFAYTRGVCTEPPHELVGGDEVIVSIGQDLLDGLHRDDPFCTTGSRRMST